MILSELVEPKGKTAVVAFGRMNPPTIGHAKLVETIKSIKGDHFLFLSQTQELDNNPLDFNTKIKFVEQFFPEITVGNSDVKNPVQMLQRLQEQGYTKIIYVAGSDRIEQFQKLFDSYNGKSDKKGVIPFEFESIQVISAGDRDPNTKGTAGMSASKMRTAAKNGNFTYFKSGAPALAEELYDAVREGMGINEINFKNVAMNVALPPHTKEKVIKAALKDGIQIAANEFNLSPRFVQELIKNYKKK